MKIAIDPHNQWFFGPNANIAGRTYTFQNHRNNVLQHRTPVYVNCILVTLNARNHIREAAASVEPSFNSSALRTAGTATITHANETSFSGEVTRDAVVSMVLDDFEPKLEK